MKVYLDVVFFLNFMFDFLLLITVAIEQKRYPKKRRVFLASLVASFSTLFLFLPLTNFTLLLLKIIVSIFMILISFGKNRMLSCLKNLYENSILLGGLIYAVDLQIRYHKNGFLFFHDKTEFSLILVLLFSPFLFYLFVKGEKKEKEQRQNLHHVTIIYQNIKMEVEGYLDTGNTIKDPYKKRSVLILSHKDFTPKIEEVKSSFSLFLSPS